MGRSQFMQYRNFNLIPNLAPPILDRQSPLSIWRLTSFQQKIEIYRNLKIQKKSHEIRFISPVALWKSGLPCLSVCYTSVYCKGAVATASHLRGEGLATKLYIWDFWADFEFEIVSLASLHIALKMSGAMRHVQSMSGTCMGHQLRYVWGIIC